MRHPVTPEKVRLERSLNKTKKSFSHKYIYIYKAVLKYRKPVSTKIKLIFKEGINTISFLQRYIKTSFHKEMK